MNIVVFGVLLIILIVGIYILKNVIKIIGLIVFLGLVLWFLDSNNIIEIKHEGDNVSLSEGTNAPKNIYNKENTHDGKTDSK